jgi:peroxiredoxin
MPDMGTETASEPKLRAGKMVPLFVLPSTGGGSTGPGAYRSKYNLVLAFAGNDKGTESYLQELSGLNTEIQAEHARVLVVVNMPLLGAEQLHSDLKLPFPLLADEDGQVTTRMLGGPLCGLCVADRYGEVISLDVAPLTEQLPPLSNALDWLLFIQAQCPE